MKKLDKFKISLFSFFILRKIHITFAKAIFIKKSPSNIESLKKRVCDKRRQKFAFLKEHFFYIKNKQPI